MTFHALLVIVFLLNGNPILMGAIFSADQACGEDQARALVNEAGVMYQGDILWSCDDVVSPGPYKHVPQQDEAMQ